MDTHTGSIIMGEGLYNARRPVHPNCHPIVKSRSSEYANGLMFDVPGEARGLHAIELKVD